MFRSLRTLAWRVALTVALLLAFGLVSGRLATLWLTEHRASDMLAELLPGAPVSVHGFEVRWHRFNPVIRVASLNLGDSRVEGLIVKPDWMESLWRRGPVLRHLSNSSAELRFEQTQTGAWALAGLPSGEGSVNWRTLLEHSDQLLVRAEVVFVTEAQPNPHLAVEINARNQRARRRWALQFFEPDCAASCRLAIELEERLRVPGYQSASLAMVAKTVGAGVRLPAALLGGTALRVARADVRWDANTRDWRSYAQSVAGGDGAENPVAARLELDLAFADITLPGGRPFDMAVSARGSSHPGYALARSFDAVITQGEQTLALPEFWLRWLPGKLQLYAPSIDLREALAQAARSRNPDDLLGQWLSALAIEGKLSDLQGQRDLVSGHWSWHAQLQDGAVTGHQGAPTADSLSGRLIGYERGLAANIQAGASTVGFPGVFSDLWPVRDLNAALELHWRSQFLTLLGQRVDAELVQGDASAPHISGAFRLAVPADRLEQTLALRLATTRLSMSTIKRFLPTKLNPALRRWLLSAPQDGLLNDVQLGYMGHVRGQQGPSARRLAVRSTVADASVRFDERWPTVKNVNGELEVSGQSAALRIDEGSSAGVSLAGTRLWLPPGGQRIEMQLRSSFDASDGLVYVRTSPLVETMSFIQPDWQASGAMQLDGEVTVPIGGLATTNVVAAELAVRLVDVNLQIPSLRTALSGLNGPLAFRTPALLSGKGIVGSLNGEALQFDVSSDSQEILFAARGNSTPRQVYGLLGLDDPGFATGQTSYSARLGFPLNQAAATTALETALVTAVPRLQLQTDLEGIALALPGELGKDPQALRPTELNASFAQDHVSAQVTQARLEAALRIVAGNVSEGELRLLGDPVDLDEQYLAAVKREYPDQAGLVISGSLAELPLAAGASGSLFGEVPVRIEQLAVGSLSADTTDLGAVVVSGAMQGDALDLSIAGAMIEGSVEQASGQPLAIDIQRLSLPDASSQGLPLSELDVRVVAQPNRQRQQVNVSTVVELADDPLPLSVQAQLPAANVSIAALQLGEEDYGRWRFTMTPTDDGVRFSELEALVKGITIEASEVFWQTEPNQTLFSGQLTAEDLATVLPSLGYAPTLETQSASVDTQISWPGSPVHFNLLSMDGEVNFNAQQGRFVDVESGNNALRIFSLLNFSALAKRMNLDFSDVLGRGISFETLQAQVQLRDGDLRFVEPMEVDGTGSKFRLGGTVDLDTGALANDMVITLPLSKGIPWYAAYVALANPLAGLGVLVGERVLRKPLEQFSSARYRVTGTLENPKAKLVKVFDNEMSEQLPADEQAQIQTEEPSQ